MNSDADNMLDSDLRKKKNSSERSRSTAHRRRAIIDPTKVSLKALQNAASIAGIIGKGRVYVMTSNPQKNCLSPFESMEKDLLRFFYRPQLRSNQKIRSIDTWSPVREIINEKNKITMKVDLSGLDQYPIEFTFDNGSLTIKRLKRISSSSASRVSMRARRS